jgi:hypothetical protein
MYDIVKNVVMPAIASVRMWGIGWRQSMSGDTDMPSKG